MPDTQVTHINEDYSNIQDFIRSLFNKDVRTLEKITRVIKEGLFYGSYSSQEDNKKMLDVLEAAWLAANPTEPPSHCMSSDNNLLTFLSNYVKKNELSMFLPSIRLLPSIRQMGLLRKKPIYELKGYDRKDFLQDAEWNKETIREFLTLVLNGAHFVVIQTAEDLPRNVSVTSLWQDLKSSPLLQSNERKDVGNSHYSRTINTNGQYFPSIDKDKVPHTPPFILTYLVCPTISDVIHAPTIYNSFFQLEGWESLPGLKGIIAGIENKGWHMADYDKHEKTLWNISTYGFSALQ